MALSRKVTASIAKAAPAPTPTTSTAASAGPAKSAKLKNIEVTAFASWMSSSGTVCGSSPLAAGRKKASAKPKRISIATICQISTVPVKISTARSP